MTRMGVARRSLISVPSVESVVKLPLEFGFVHAMMLKIRYFAYLANDFRFQIKTVPSLLAEAS
jgi:hypothetical protein